jgi:hypothetical protein
MPFICLPIATLFCVYRYGFNYRNVPFYYAPPPLTRAINIYAINRSPKRVDRAMISIIDLTMSSGRNWQTADCHCGSSTLYALLMKISRNDRANEAASHTPEFP